MKNISTQLERFAQTAPGATVDLRGQGRGFVLANVPAGCNVSDIDLPEDVSSELASMADFLLSSPMRRLIVRLESGALAVGKWTTSRLIKQGNKDGVLEFNRLSVGDYVTWMPHGPAGATRFGCVVAVVNAQETPRSAFERQGVDLQRYAGLGRIGMDRVRPITSYVMRAQIISRSCEELIHPRVPVKAMTSSERIMYAAE